jgi:hypothetical protein
VPAAGDYTGAQVTYTPAAIGPLTGQDTVQAAVGRLAGGWNPSRIMTSSVFGTLYDDPSLVYDQVSHDLEIVDGGLKTSGAGGRSTYGISPVSGYYTNSGGVAFSRASNGALTITGNTVGSKNIYIPIDVPIRSNGSYNSFVSARVCYMASSAASPIIFSQVQSLGSTNFGITVLASDNTDYNSTTGACYTFSDAAPFLQFNGALLLYLNLDIDTAGHEVTIGNIQVTLQQD